MARTFNLELKEHGIFRFRVNFAVANSEGRLEVMVVDVGYQKDEASTEVTPAQQAVIKSTWEQDKITDVVSDLSNVQHARWRLDEGLMGRYVSGMLRSIAKSEKNKRLRVQENLTEDISQVVIVVPDSYSAGIN